jgi:hypothetical protein
VFVTVSHLHFAQIFAEPTQEEHLVGLHSEGRLQALPANNRLEWKLLTVTNTLAYQGMELITTAKSFIMQYPDLANA